MQAPADCPGVNGRQKASKGKLIAPLRCLWVSLANEQVERGYVPAGCGHLPAHDQMLHSTPPAGGPSGAAIALCA